MAMTYDELIDMLELQVANLPTYKTDIGATEEEITQVGKDLDNLKAARDYADIIDAAKKTAVAIKQAQFNGEEGADIQAYAPISAGSLPDPTVKAGALTRALDRDRHWKTASGYSHEIGVALGIEKATEPEEPSTIQPTAEVDPAQSGDYLASVLVKNRGKSTLFEVFARVVGTTEWVSLGRFSKRSADITWPNGDGKPVMLDFRIQLLKDDAPYGQLSAIVSATLNP